MRAKGSFIFVLASLLIFFFSSSAQTAIVSEGEVNPWVESNEDVDITDYTTFFIGINSEGAVIIDSGSTLSSRGAFLGMEETGTGSVKISGPYSLWKILAADPLPPNEEVGLIHIGFGDGPHGLDSLSIELSSEPAY
jgi:hypothetical protein